MYFVALLLSLKNVRFLNGISNSTESNIQNLKKLFKQYDQPKKFERLLNQYPNLVRIKSKLMNHLFEMCQNRPIKDSIIY